VAVPAGWSTRWLRRFSLLADATRLADPRRAARTGMRSPSPNWPGCGSAKRRPTVSQHLSRLLAADIVRPPSGWWNVPRTHRDPTIRPCAISSATRSACRHRREDCIFCGERRPSDALAERLAIAIPAGFPVSPRPRPHRSPASRAGLLLAQRRRAGRGDRLGEPGPTVLDRHSARRLQPRSQRWEGGRSAILHTHLHVIPRYAGDVARLGRDPLVLPETARYW